MPNGSLPGWKQQGEHWFLDVIGTAGLVREQTATFYTGIDEVRLLDRTSLSLRTRSQTRCDSRRRRFAGT